MNVRNNDKENVMKHMNVYEPLTNETSKKEDKMMVERKYFRWYAYDIMMEVVGDGCLTANFRRGKSQPIRLKMKVR